MLLTKTSLFPPENLLITHSNLRSKLKGPRFVVKRTQNEESKIKKITFFFNALIICYSKLIFNIIFLAIVYKGHKMLEMTQNYWHCR